MSETQFVGNHLHVDTTWVLSVGVYSPMEATMETPEFNIKPPLWDPILIFPRGNLLMSFPHGDTSARKRSLKSVFLLLCELSKAIELHLLVCQLYRWQLGPNTWSSPTTKSLDPIVVTALRVGFPCEGLRPVTCGIAHNCPTPEAWITETSELLGLGLHDVAFFLLLDLFLCSVICFDRAVWCLETI